jgi:hypothetical protein
MIAFRGWRAAHAAHGPVVLDDVENSWLFSRRQIINGFERHNQEENMELGKRRSNAIKARLAQQPLFKAA